MHDRPAFPLVLDSSMLRDFKACPRKFEFSYLYHWKPRSERIDLVAGAAFAKGLEEARRAYFVEHSTPEVALAKGLHALVHAYGAAECPPDNPKSLDRMLGALEYYFEQYPLASEAAPPLEIRPGRFGIEFSFSEPLPNIHPETHDPILYCGRMDQIVRFQSATFIEDDKTTKALGASWPQQWDLRSQFTGYAWGCMQAGIPVTGVLIRGVSILKTRYDTLQAISYRPPWLIERWYEDLQHQVERIRNYWQQGRFPHNYDDACDSYGGCIFRKVCNSQHPDTWLKVDFVQRRWDPVTRTETPL